MNLTFRGTCFGTWFGLAAALALGCGSSSGAGYVPEQDASATPDATTIDARPDVVVPPPPIGDGNVRLFSGSAQLLLNGQPCTSTVGATGDRWCAFVSPSKTNLSLLDLFVVNVSRAAAGTAVTCGSPVGDPNCLRLTGGFFEESQPPAPHGAKFVGDTLLYFDVTGVPYAWRPGMTDGRRLAIPIFAGDLHDCTAAAQGWLSIACLQDLPTQPPTGEVHSALVAGLLDSATSPPLVQVDTVISSNPLDANLPRFQFGFPTPTGDMLAWSSRATPNGPEILKAQEIDSIASQQTVATDVDRWTTSPDGTQWYWLSQFVSTSGTLQTAPFPGGASPTTLLASARSYQVAPNGALAVVSSTGDLGAIIDPVAAPGTITPIDTGVLGVIRVSRQGHAVYAKTLNSLLGFVDLYVKKLDGTGSRCTLTSQVDGEVFAAFPPAAGSVLWARVDLNAPVGDPPRGLFTSLANCTTTTIATAVLGLATAGDNGVLFTDTATAVGGTLKLQNVIGGGTLDPSPPTVVQTAVDNFVTVFPTPGAVVFTVNASSASDGVYVHAFASAPDGADGGSD
jgi:hypothetical protein